MASLREVTDFVMQQTATTAAAAAHSHRVIASRENFSARNSLHTYVDYWPIIKPSAVLDSVMGGKLKRT